MHYFVLMIDRHTKNDRRVSFFACVVAALPGSKTIPCDIRTVDTPTATRETDFLVLVNSRRQFVTCTRYANSLIILILHHPRHELLPKEITLYLCAHSKAILH